MENVDELLALIESIPEGRAGRALALRNALRLAWADGHRHCYDGGGEADNPYDETN